MSYLHHYISDDCEMLADCEANDRDREDDEPTEGKQQVPEMALDRQLLIISSDN